MTGMVEKNYLDGYMDKAQHDKALKGIREATSQISPQIARAPKARSGSLPVHVERQEPVHGLRQGSQF